MKKALALVLALMMVLALSACGGEKAAPAEFYTGESDWVEAGYEGDCIITNRLVLVLNPDGTYFLEDGFFVNQVMGSIVFYTKTVYIGTYTAGEANAEGIKTVTLAAPTDGSQNLNGVIATAADDADILPSFNPALGTIQVDVNAHGIVSEIPHHS